MPLSLDALFAPLNDFFLKKFGTDQGSPLLFRFDRFGSVVSDEDFIADGHPELGYDANLATEVFSDLVNNVPREESDGVNIVFTDTSIDDAYYFQLLTASCPYFPEDADEPAKKRIQKHFDAIKAKALDDWRGAVWESSSGLILDYKPSLPTPSNWYDRSKAELWTHQSFRTGAKQAPPAAGVPKAELWTLKIDDAAMRGLFKIDEAKPAPAADQAFKRVMDLRAGGRAPMLAHRATPLDPAPGPRMPAMRMGARVAMRRAAAGSVPEGVAVDTPAAVGRLGARAPGRFGLHDLYRREHSILGVRDRLVVNRYFGSNAPTKPAVTEEASISFDYCLVNIRRPWYLDTFINDEMWCVPGIGKGARSSQNDPGNLSLLPSGFIAIKSLTIEAKWAPEDSENANSAIAFGPFKVDPGIVNGKLSHEGIQIIGWLLQRMPALPPNDSSDQP